MVKKKLNLWWTVVCAGPAWRRCTQRQPHLKPPGTPMPPRMSLPNPSIWLEKAALRWIGLGWTGLSWVRLGLSWVGLVRISKLAAPSGPEINEKASVIGLQRQWYYWSSTHGIQHGMAPNAIPRTHAMSSK